MVDLNWRRFVPGFSKIPREVVDLHEASAEVRKETARLELLLDEMIHDVKCWPRCPRKPTVMKVRKYRPQTQKYQG